MWEKSTNVSKEKLYPADPQAKKRATKPLDRSPSRPLEAPIRHMIWSSQDGDPSWDNPANAIPARKIERATYTTLPNGAGTNTTERHPHPSKQGSRLGADNLTLEGVSMIMAPSVLYLKLRDFGRPHARGNKKEIKPEPIGPT
ncbi:hypothetical protein Tco_0045517 [Tanacetum coccineum]